ncbi:MAG TPA: ABC transporter permease [Gemmatimonadales bacterium]|nr:ABC transporter permease [Gemmatimonadales bacterium]
MRKVLAIIRREFVERVRRRAFWVMAMLGPVFFAVVFFAPLWLSGSVGVQRIVVVDRATPPLGAAVARRLDSTRSFVVVGRIPDAPGVEDSLARAVGGKAIDGFLLVSDSLVERGTAEYRAANVSSLEAVGLLRETLRRSAEIARLERAGVDPLVVAHAQMRLILTTHKITRGRTTGESAGQSFSLAYFMMVILYVALLLYGVQVMGSVMEEKTSRIVEVLVSSVTPFQLLAGKVLGVGAVSLLQFLIWGLAGRFLLGQRGAFVGQVGSPAEAASQPFQVPHVSAATGLVFIAFFLGGFFLYSAMFAAVGAMSSTEQEARQTQTPVTVLIMLAFFSSFGVIANPESPLAVTLSLVPFTAPIATPARWAAGNLSWVDVTSSFALLVAGTVAVTWVAARIYRVGILMTGKRPSLRELWRWVKTA